MSITQKTLKTLSVDAEVDGLYGQTFAIAFTVREKGVETFKWQGRIPDSSVSDEWVKQNVLPKLQDMPITHNTSTELEEAFWSAYMQHKDGATVIAHCGSPVESGLFRRCVERDLANRQWDAPFPLHDVATALLYAGENPTSVESYMTKYGLTPEFKGATHHPMYDAVVAAQVLEHLLGHSYKCFILDDDGDKIVHYPKEKSNMVDLD